MIYISKINTENSKQYLAKLANLIETTIVLPAAAKNAYKNQWSLNKINSLINDWLFLAAHDEENNMRGVLLGTPDEGGVGTIIWVLVEPNNQKKGIGGLLFKKACDLYKINGAHKVKLTVPDENTVNFYKKQGMHLEGTHHNHWYGADFWSMGMNI